MLVYVGVLYAADTADARKGLRLRRPPPLLRTLARILRRLAEKEALQGFDAGQVLSLLALLVQKKYDTDA